MVILSAEHKAYIEVLETNLSEICSPFLKNLSIKHAHISSMEVQVANLIKAGKRNKEIASILGVSLNTVMTHRYRLRSKLGIETAEGQPEVLPKLHRFLVIFHH